MEKIICKAQIEPKEMKLNIFVTIAGLVISAVLYLVASWVCIIKEATSNVNALNYGHYYGKNIFGEYIAYEKHHFEPHFNLELESGVQVAALILAAVCVAIRLVYITVHNDAKRCVLNLDGKGINGTRKNLFSNKALLLPMDKIDSIAVQSGILDKIFGGQTIAIRSASGLIKFPWVQNAQEFVDTTLAEIQKYNEAAELKSQPAPAAPVSDDFEKIQKLKNLLDQGLLTQEEYDAKRRELLEKI